jgi:DNA-binding LytR/AlgR family response regulator
MASSEKILVRMTLKEVLPLANNFKNKRLVQCHKSYLINATRISAVKSDFIKIKELKIPIGKQYASIFLDKIKFAQK